MRKITAALAAGLFIASAAVTAMAAPRPGILVVRKRAMNPTRLAGNGGSVFVRVQVTKKRATIIQVSAQGSVGSSSGKYAALTRKGAFWEGNVVVPRNPTRQAASGTIVINVTTSVGAEQKVLARIPMLPGTDTYPPDPPK